MVVNIVIPAIQEVKTEGSTQGQVGKVNAGQLCEKLKTKRTWGE
jgi:hypothetical protein